MNLDEPLPLPGLEPMRAGGRPLELAARQSIAAVADQLDDRHALTLALVLELATVVALSAEAGKASAAALAANQLREAWASLPLDDDDSPDAFGELVRQINEAAAAGSSSSSST